jgi:hypothetical protein
MLFQYRENLEYLFKENFLRRPYRPDNPEKFASDSLRRKERAISLLEKNQRVAPNDLPVQEVDSNLINLSYNIDNDKYERVLDATTREMKIYAPADPNLYMIVTGGFLGVSVFGNHIVLFDPRPNFVINPAERSIFPGYDPIYSKSTKQELLEYVYTAEYPANNIPVFPNFKVGNFVIDGAKYNPIYDKRNYRLNGSYRSDGVFNSDKMEEYSAGLIRSALVDRQGQGKFLLLTDVYNTGPQDLFQDGRIHKVIGSGLYFKSVTDDVLEQNKANGIDETFAQV